MVYAWHCCRLRTAQAFNKFILRTTPGVIGRKQRHDTVCAVNSVQVLRHRAGSNIK
jgi:hypothetical protein